MLLEFFGRECPYCYRMHPLVEKLEKEFNVKVEKYEVWHNEENAKEMEKYDKGLCGGVPFFFNTETNGFICGGTSFGKLKEWANVK